MLLGATAGTPALFCHATQQRFLRLVSTPAIFHAYRSAPIPNRDALSALAAFAALPQLDLIEEPPDLEVLWWQLASAFAIRGSLRMIRLDRDFEQFLGAGLDLDLLPVEPGHGA